MDSVAPAPAVAETPPSWSDVISDPRWNTIGKEKKLSILDDWQHQITKYAEDSGQNIDMDKHTMFVEGKKYGIEQEGHEPTKAEQIAEMEGDAQEKSWKNAYDTFVPSVEGAKEGFKSGQETGKQFLGDNIAGKAIGAVLGAMGVAGEAGKPLSGAGTAIERLAHSTGQEIAGNPELSGKILAGESDPTPYINLNTPREGVIGNALQDFGKTFLSTPVNTSAALASIGELGLGGVSARALAEGSQLPGFVKTLSPGIADAFDIAKARQLQKVMGEAVTPESAARIPPVIPNRIPPVIAETGTPAAIPKVAGPLPEKPLSSGMLSRGSINKAAERKEAAGAKGLLETVAKNAADNVDPALGQGAKDAAAADATARTQNALNVNIPKPHLEALKTVTPDELPVLNQMLDESEAFHDSGGKTRDPMLTVGDQYLKPVEQVKAIVDQYGHQIGELSDKMEGGGDKLDFSNDVLSNLKKTKGLTRLAVNEDGTLNFENTAVRLNKSTQKTITDLWNDSKQLSPYQAHVTRQGLFEDIDTSNLTNIQDKAINAVRRGLSDGIDKVSPEYKAINKKYATALDTLQQLTDHLRDPGEKNGAVLSMDAAQLARRLTSNARSKSDIMSALANAQTLLKEHGLPQGVNVKNVQDYWTILNEYYNLDPKTSLAGILKTTMDKAGKENGGLSLHNATAHGVIVEGLKRGGKAAIKRVVGDTEITPEVQRYFMKDFIKNLKPARGAVEEIKPE